MMIPLYTVVAVKHENGEPLDPIEQFILDEEPGEFEADKWRAQLQAALDHARKGAP